MWIYTFTWIIWRDKQRKFQISNIESVALTSYLVVILKYATDSFY